MMVNTSHSDLQDRNLANFIVGYYFVQAINLLVKLVIGEFAMWSFLSRGILIILLLFSLKSMIERKGKEFLGAELFFASLFGYTFVFHYASFSEYSSIVINVFTVFIPMAIAVVCINNMEILLNRMYIMAWPTQIILWYVLLTRSSFDYSMIGGYTLIFQSLIVFDHFMNKHKWYDLLICIIDLIAVFIFGSRGPILCFLAMIVIKILFSPSISIVKRVSRILIAFSLSGLLFVFYNNIIRGLIALTEHLGYSSRNMYLLLNGRIASESGRDSIYRAYFDVIRNGPVLGHGIAGGWIANGSYPHSIFLEFLVSFGPVVGVLTSIAVACIAIYSISKAEDDTRRICHILFAYSLSLFISDTFLKSPMFFMLMGLGLKVVPIRISKKNK